MGCYSAILLHGYVNMSHIYESFCVKSEKSEVFEMESHYPIIVSVLQTNESDVLFLQSDLGTLPSSTKTFNLGNSISKRYPIMEVYVDGQHCCPVPLSIIDFHYFQL